VTPTEQYIKLLTGLKPGALGLLRTHAGQGLDETVDGFDLFTGLWWPLRRRNERAPRRQVAWLIAKLYALRPIKHSPGETLPRQLAKLRPDEERAQKRFRQKVDKQKRFRRKVDKMLTLPLDKIEPALQWALDLLGSKGLKLDWVSLTNDLSIWERESVRLKWAEEFLKSTKEDSDVDRNSHDSKPQPGQPEPG